MSIGIYMIRNLSNNKVYIGQSTDINRRWNNHKMKLKNNIHYNEHLQKSYNKYGEKFFQYSILCETSKENLNELESYYIQKYQSDKSTTPVQALKHCERLLRRLSQHLPFSLALLPQKRGMRTCLFLPLLIIIQVHLSLYLVTPI